MPLQRTSAALAGAAAVVETLRDRGGGGGADADFADLASGDADADFADLASGAPPWGALRSGAAEARRPRCAQVIAPTKAECPLCPSHRSHYGRVPA